MPPPTAPPLTLPDGRALALHDWPLAPERRRATVLLVHGLGEHAGRYDALARRLNGWGLGVRGYDQQGHGASGGARGSLHAEGGLYQDLACVLDATRAGMAANEPLVLLGHSLGGLVAADLMARGLRPVNALVLSSPALAVHTSALQRLLLATLPRLLPGLRVANGLDARGLSHDAQVVAAYRADPLCHDRISARLARYVATGGAPVLAAAPGWRVPTLLLWGEDDRIVDPGGSRAFAAAAPGHVVTARGFAGLLHEVFNEADAEPVMAQLHAWLALHLGDCP
ncbi:Lysophospholipase, alpha-beta hydrolase superfamily [Oryzisolibacter propanilivorax]|uniref:Lysophospholipase, alpha-beta hydrolase superfamily n=1 Tax=Oryzisolibacter propanilivorax TaxID=1527607 RepID=A0A1G9QNV4_9BURK|nr:alpha/beta hydrolase [Oryzisolibacter propanilivorax]SDM12676.1 Lysophospholipase, alpha-beta hydrolase superfamily [Oryzisolibacter propanilivorax]